VVTTASIPTRLRVTTANGTDTFDSGTLTVRCE
jgi:hypothetical protein